jgi:hypothetical protein
MLGNAHFAITAPALPGRRAHQTCRVDAGQRADTFDETLEEGNLLNRLWVTRHGQAEVHGQNVIDRYAEISGSQPLIAFQKQPCSDQQHYGQAHFQH